MRKSIFFALLTTLAAASTTAVAQTEPTRKVIETTTQTVSTIDGSLSATYRNVNRYDRHGRQIEWVQYSADSGSYNGGEIFEYDAEGRLVNDVTSGTKWTYTYGADGRVAMKTKYTAGADGTLAISSYQYVGYDEEGRVLYEANHSTTGQLTDSVRYNYEGELLMTADTYMQSGKTTYSVMKRVRYAYNETGLVTRSLQMSVYGTSESITRGNGYKYDDQLRLVADTVLAADADPRYLTLYYYEGDSTESSGNEYYRISNDGWMKSEVRTNVYGTISERRTPSLLAAAQTAINGPVVISVAAPVETAGYQGYRIIVDHTEYADILTAETAELQLQRGSHDIRVVAVYDGVEANTSDAVSVDVDFLLPSATDVKVRTMEYKYAWTVTIGWDAPAAADGLHPTGYRVVYPTPWGYNNEAVTKNLQTSFTYSGKECINVEVYAIYAEGESDAATLAIDLTDTSRMVTEHWHNASMTRYENGKPVSVAHYYYLDNDNNLTRPELLTTTVTYDTDGTPLTRYVAAHMETNYAKLLCETTERWDATRKAWEEYEVIEYVYNSINQVGEKITRHYDKTEGEYVVVATEESSYDDAVSGTMPAETRCYTVENGEKTLVQSKTFEHIMDAVGVQRMETATIRDAAGAITSIVRTFRHATTGTEIHLDSVFVYSPSMELVQSEKMLVSPSTGLDAAYVVRDAEGRIIAQETYAASKEYHSTHRATDLTCTDGTLSWTAPSRTEGLEGYTLLIDDVVAASLPADVTSHKVVADVPSGMHDFRLVPIYDGAEATATGSVFGKYDNALELSISKVQETVVTTPVFYDLQGRRTNGYRKGVVIKDGHTIIR